MSLFQIIGIGVLGLLALASLRSYRGGRMRLPGLTLWWALSATGSLALLYPNATTIIAHVIGVERGSDLLFYSAILAGLFVAFLGYLRLKILDRQITRLVRQHALDHPRRAGETPSDAGETTHDVTP